MITISAGFWWRKRQKGFVPGPENFGTTDERHSTLYGLIPLILGIHVAVPLLVSGVSGELFTPNNKLPGAWMYLFGLAQTGIALAIFYGALTRLAAVALAILWFLGIFIVGFEAMLESSMYLGFAAFFFFAGHLPIYSTFAVLITWSAERGNLDFWLNGLREKFLPILLLTKPLDENF